MCIKHIYYFNLCASFHSCVACVGKYPLNSDIPTSLEFQPSSFGHTLDIKTPEDMKNILSVLDKSISTSKEQILAIDTTQSDQTKGIQI